MVEMDTIRKYTPRIENRPMVEKHNIKKKQFTFDYKLTNGRRGYDIIRRNKKGRQ